MDIKGKIVLVLGGYGEVGMAVCKSILRHNPEALVVTSLREEEALSAVKGLSDEEQKRCRLIPFYGNLFVRWPLRDMALSEIALNPDHLRQVVDDNMGEISEEILTSSTLYRAISEYSPEIIIDCINTATAMAYRNVFYAYENTCRHSGGSHDLDKEGDVLYRLLSTISIPPLIRHVQILYEAMKRAGTGFYLKIGTTGTGGMGLNIPFTHGEESPSRLLMSKSAVAGAHSMLLFVLSRTPGGPIIKEIKPAAMIGWKAIKKGRVMRGGKGISVYDSSMENAYPLISGETFSLAHIEAGSPIPDRDIEGTFIDTGENGVFSLEEFKAITSLGLMEFVTPEEVADLVMLNIKGAPNSKDMMSAIDASVLGSTYRAGLLRDCAVRQMEGLGEDGISYGFLGPRLSKLVFEARLLKDCFAHVENVLARQPSDISRILEARVLEDNILRTMAISIGIPFLLSDGQRLVFAHRVMQDKEWEEKPWVVSSDSIDRFASREWIDLRSANIAKWQVRFSRLLEEMKASFHEESSCFDRGRGFWKKDQEGRTLIDAGEVAAWVLIKDYGGGRR